MAATFNRLTNQIVHSSPTFLMSETTIAADINQSTSLVGAFKGWKTPFSCTNGSAGEFTFPPFVYATPPTLRNGVYLASITSSYGYAYYSGHMIVNSSGIAFQPIAQPTTVGGTPYFVLAPGLVNQITLTITMPALPSPPNTMTGQLHIVALALE